MAQPPKKKEDLSLTTNLTKNLIKAFPQYKGLSEKDFLALLQKIEGVETLNKNIHQLNGGPGRGYYQVELRTAPVAYNRAQTIQKELKQRGIDIALPRFEKDFTKLTKDEQSFYAIANMVGAAGAKRLQGQKDYYFNPKDAKKAWLDLHWAGPNVDRPARIKHWEEMYGKDIPAPAKIKALKQEISKPQPTPQVKKTQPQIEEEIAQPDLHPAGPEKVTVSAPSTQPVLSNKRVKQLANTKFVPNPIGIPIFTKDKKPQFIWDKPAGELDIMLHGRPGPTIRRAKAMENAEAIQPPTYAHGSKVDKYKSIPRTGLRYPKIVTIPPNQRSNYDPTSETIYLAKGEDPTVVQHEMFHHWQKLNDNLSTGPVKESSMLDLYPAGMYNRREGDIQDASKKFLQKNPSFLNVPFNLLYDKEVEPAMYNYPEYGEGEAEEYQNYIRAGGEPVFPEQHGRGGLIKRKDGSYSKRGLWDNIRANKGSGKKPTKEMLRQERKIRAAEKKEDGGPVYNWIPPNYPRVGARNEQGGWLDQYEEGSSIEDQKIPDTTAYEFGNKFIAYPDKILTNYQMGTPKSTLPDGKIVDATPEIPAYAHGATVWNKRLADEQMSADYVVGPDTNGTQVKNTYPDRMSGAENPTNYKIGDYIPVGMNYKSPAAGTYDYNKDIQPYYKMRLHAPDTTRMAYGGYVPMYGKGGFLKGLGDVGLFLADTALSPVNQDIIGNKRYSDTGFGKTVKDISNVTGSISNSLAPMAANMIMPGAGTALSMAQGFSNNFVDQDKDRLASKTGQIGNQIGQGLGLASSVYSLANPQGFSNLLGGGGGSLAGAGDLVSSGSGMIAKHGGRIPGLRWHQLNPGVSALAGIYTGPTTQRGITFADGGDVPPYVTSDPKEFAKRQQAYKDSAYAAAKYPIVSNGKFFHGETLQDAINFKNSQSNQEDWKDWYKQMYTNFDEAVEITNKTKIQPVGAQSNSYIHNNIIDTPGRTFVYAKPKQKVIFNPEIAKMPMRNIPPLNVNIKADIKSRPTYRNWNTGEVMYDIPEHLKIGSNWRSPEKKANGGDVPPLYVSNPNDPRLKSYNDSLALFKSYGIAMNKLKKDLKAEGRSLKHINIIPFKGNPHVDNYKDDKILPIGFSRDTEAVDFPEYIWSTPIYKQPVQPVIYQPTPPVRNKPATSSRSTYSKITKMPMRGMPSVSTEEAMPQKVNVPKTNLLPTQYMDTRGEWSDKPQVPPGYTEEQLLKMGYRAPKKKNGGWLDNL